MLSVDQIKTYNNDGLVKSSTQLSSDKVKDLNLALDKYLEDHNYLTKQTVTSCDVPVIF